MKTRTSGQGRRPGTPNKVTRETREALALLIEQNIEKLQDWLDRVAETDPAKAMALLLQMAEFTIPKMARTEVSGPNGLPIVTEPPKLEIILNQ